MGNKLKFAIIGLLGFSTACSTAKKSQKSNDETALPQTEERVPTIQVMYGVRRPQPLPVQEMKPNADPNIEKVGTADNSGSDNDNREQ